MDYYLDFEKPLYELESKISDLRKISQSSNDKKFTQEINKLEAKAVEIKTQIYSELSDWQKIQISRHPQRPYTLDYISNIFTDYVELSGDRNFSDDAAIVGGLASIDGRTVVIIGHQKGRTTPEKIKRNFGMPRPEGYRKALRLMTLADRLKKPIITFIDTPGAYPGIDAEERGQSEAIAKNLLVMSRLEVPIISVVIGEGGSGGALAVGVANRLLMLEYSMYSVISPEACAAILLRDSTKGSEIVNSLKITASYLKKFNIADEIIKEPEGGAHRDYKLAAMNIKMAILKTLKELQKMNPQELRDDRYLKFRKIGVYKEKT